MKLLPRLELYPTRAHQGVDLVLRGSGWPRRSVTLRVDGRAARFHRILLGAPIRGGVRPDANGDFVVTISTLGMTPRTHKVTARAGTSRPVSVTVTVSPRPSVDDSGRLLGKPFRRFRHFISRRFGRDRSVPPGVRATQIADVRARRKARDAKKGRRAPAGQGLRLPVDLPTPGSCNWNPLGPGPLPRGQTADPVGQAVSGRATSIALDPKSPGTVYLGTAHGGVWKSTDSGDSWWPKTDYAMSLAIGALALDPNDSSRVFAGTGEYYLYTDYGEYFGSGILFSHSAGEGPWQELATETFAQAAITRILFDPTDPTSQRMFLSSSLGVYQSLNGGTHWTQLRAGPASDLVVTHAVEGQSVVVRLLAAFVSEGLFTSARSGSAWGAWTKVVSPGLPVFGDRIALGQCQHQPDILYTAFTSGVQWLKGISRSDDGGINWTPTAVPPVTTLQIDYNLHISIHPTKPDIVYFGEKDLWRSTDGGKSWVDVTAGAPDAQAKTGDAIGLHADQHALAFDVANPDIVWALNDGGVFRSIDGGSTWTHRNRGLATFQYNAIAQHPQWDAVLLGGSQDNGRHRSAGHPAWSWCAGGDGSLVAIDPSLPTCMYGGLYYVSIQRSDDAGVTWSDKVKGISGSAPFVPPFALDPVHPHVCYFGGAEVLWRSPDRADSWQPMANLDGEATAIAVDPNDGAVYVGTVTGRVYRVVKKGNGWARSDLGGPILALGGAISDIAVDGKGTVWVSSANVNEDIKGELTNNHVFRRLAGGKVWETRSNGLVKANPVNTIVVDPANDGRLFCGADVGVFRTENAGVSWKPWDEGLPNVPVIDLAIHQPLRLLRAATYGRSVWERPIDAVSCPMVDLYARDNILDTGRVQPSPSGYPHPFDPTVLVDRFHSVDIKVDAPLYAKTPDYQTSKPTDDYVVFEGVLQHREPRRGAVNRVYLQVQNRGVGLASNVTARVFVANGPVIPPLPAGFWSNGSPFASDPPAGDWVPLGKAQTLGTVGPAMPAVFHWDWALAQGAAGGRCLLALVTCDEDPIAAGQEQVVGTLVAQSKHAALRLVDIKALLKKGPPAKYKPHKPVHPKWGPAGPSKPKKKTARARTEAIARDAAVSSRTV